MDYDDLLHNITNWHSRTMPMEATQWGPMNYESWCKLDCKRINSAAGALNGNPAEVVVQGNMCCIRRKNGEVNELEALK